MLNLSHLREFSGVSLWSIDRARLVDLKDVTATGDRPAARLQNYVSQVGNPYCFRVGSIPVQISFVGKRSLEDCLRSYYTTLKNGCSTLTEEVL